MVKGITNLKSKCVTCLPVGIDAVRLPVITQDTKVKCVQHNQ